jgi:hypothetical protein
MSVPGGTMMDDLLTHSESVLAFAERLSTLGAAKKK